MDIGLEKPIICKGYNLGILYEKFGYTVQLLERKHGVDIYNMMIDSRINRTVLTCLQNETKIRKLKNEIRHAVDSAHFNSVGLFDDDELIGISFNSINPKINQPWWGLFMVKKHKTRTRAPLVLANYVLNHLYGAEGYIMRLSTDSGFIYDKEIRNLPLVIGYSVFKDGFKERIKKMCGE